MMIQSRMIGDARVTRVLEYSGPTHAPEFLFPEVPKAERDAAIAANAGWLAPTHYVPHMDRFIVTIQLWLVQAGANTILIDTGVGSLKHRAAPRMNMLNTLVMPWLEAAGAAADQVTHVVHTHLHTDHVGGNTVERDGRFEPAFPNARYLMPKTEFDYWKAAYDAGDAMVQAGSFADSVLPVLEAGLVDFYDGDKELAGCLAPESVPGHSPGLTALRLRSNGEEGYFSTDTMHSPIQIACPHWNDRYIIWPDQARQSRARVLARAAERGALIMPMHFGAPYCGYVRRQGDGYRFEPGVW
jgi:glyoxylase-like metal-dependent hydrolase (beta-lactamase superfamily II)